MKKILATIMLLALAVGAFAAPRAQTSTTNP
jgi:hypothetical protein